MKKVDLEKKLRSMGWQQAGGGKHDKWTNGRHSIAVPRHREINEHTARGIIRQAERYSQDKE
jgi:mRNA interferase HicA